MTKLILSMFLFTCLTANSQNENPIKSTQNRIGDPIPPPPTYIQFSYDVEGNQIERKFFRPIPRGKNTAPKEIVTIKEENIQEISADNLISYYPNPVKDELHLDWKLVQDNAFASIHVYDLNGHLVQSYSNGTRANSQTISFLNYPTGVYAVVLVYNNGKQKSIKIIKQ
jgi:hypothetical protein